MADAATDARARRRGPLHQPHPSKAAAVQAHSDAALRESEQKFATIFRRSPVAKALGRGPDGRLVDVNDAWISLTGIAREDASGKSPAELGLVASPSWRGLYERVRTLGSSAEGQFVLQTRAAGPRTAHVWAQRVVLGGEDFLLSVMEDVTEQRQTQEALRESDRRKSEFISVLSHELRNPLAPMSNAIYILDHAPPSSEQAARARDILRRQTEHLASMVDDLLEVTRISRGTIQLERTRIDLRAEVRSSSPSRSPRATRSTRRAERSPDVCAANRRPTGDSTRSGTGRVEGCHSRGMAR